MTITVTSSTPLSEAPSVTVSGACLATASLSTTLDASGQTATASYSVPAGASDCAASVQAAAIDPTGVAATGGSATLVVDRTPPSVVETPDRQPDPSGWYAAPVSLSVTGSDATSGIAAVYIGPATCAPATPAGCTLYSGPNPFATTVTMDGALTVYGFVVDGAGNASSQLQGTLRLDQVPPTVSAALAGTLGRSGWYTSPVTVSVTASDATSGVASLRTSVDGGVWQEGAAVTVAADGAHTVQYAAGDVAGNSSAPQSTTFSIDTTAPTIALATTGSPGANGWYTSPVSVSVSAADATSGVAGLTTAVDGAAAVAQPAQGGAVSVSGDGAHVLQVTATDVAGNVSSKTASLSIDTTGPTAPTSLAGQAGATTGTLSLTWSASTDATSGVAGYTVYAAPRTSTGCPSGAASYAASAAAGTSTTLAGLTGGASYCVFVRATDRAGNVSASSPTIVVRARR